MKQDRFKQLCNASWQAYRFTALGYSAFQVYTNPWIVQVRMTPLHHIIAGLACIKPTHPVASSVQAILRAIYFFSRASILGPAGWA